MTVPNQPNRLHSFLPYLLTVFSFIGGFYVNYLSYTNKVDGLIDVVNKLNTKMDAQGTNYNGLDKRMSKIEFYLFEYKRPVSTP